MADAASPPAAPRSFGDVGAIAACSLIWGTTWYAIQLQLGGVDPQISVVYRFLIAAALLALVARGRGERLRLSRGGHVAALGMGFFTFAVDYSLVYFGSERLASGVVAVIFASLAFVNLIVFRLAAGEKAPRLAWAATILGVAGVAALVAEELRTADVTAQAGVGAAMVFGGVVCAAISNLFAARAQRLGVGVAALSGWAMGYGGVMLAVFATLRGAAWTFEPTFVYAGSLVYLAVFGSVVAFVLYYGLARRRGYTLASYISALTPPIALLASSLFEGKTWTPLALAGVATVVAGQVLLMRAKAA